jgi:hypothetical protein
MYCLRRTTAPALACLALLLGSCTPRLSAEPPADPPASPPAGLDAAAWPLPSSATTAAAPRAQQPVAGASSGCPDESTWSCAQQQRFAAAQAYVRQRVGGRGYLGVVFTDRQSGHSWRLGPTQQDGWTASTIKLAIATDLLIRQRSGEIPLSGADQRDLASMLHVSDSAATDRLWARYGGSSMLARFRDRYGMTGLHFVPGFSASTYWGFVKCTPEDLAALLGFVFNRLAGPDLAYLIDALRGVAPNQQWGVWAAGPAQRPGNKNGWSYETDGYGKHWVTNTAGFAGPDERYLIAVMYQLDPGNTLEQGVHTVSDVVALLFGEPVPAAVTVPAPDG